MDTFFQSLPVLPMVRVLAVASAFPQLTGFGAPRAVRIAVGLALGFILVPYPFHLAQRSLPPLAIVASVPFEALLGFAIGWAFTLVFQVLTMAGDFIGQEMGLNIASQIDPVTGRPVPVVASLLEVVGLVLFVETGGLALLLQCVRQSFEILPSGSVIPVLPMSGTLAEMSAKTVALGVTFALPAAVLLMLLTVFTAFTARVLPRLHVFDFAFSLRILAALLLLSVLAPRLVGAVLQVSGDVFSRVRTALVSG